MDSIITTNLKDITLSSQFLTLKTPNGEAEIDIKKLLKEPIGSDTAFFNATQIAKMFDKKFAQITRDKSWTEYVDIMEETLKSKGAEFAHLKLIKTVRGKYHSGTWLHSKLIIEFLRRLDIRFAVSMDLFIQDLITHSNELKIDRNNTKILFEPLTETIRDIYIPNQLSDNSKKFAYSTLSNLINMKVLGCSAKKYIKDNDLLEDVPLRDQLSKDKLKQIEKLEEDLNGYIKYGGIVDYEKLKEVL